MKRTDGNADRGESGGGSGSTFFSEKKKKRKMMKFLGGRGGLSLEALAFAKNKPFVTASQIRKQRELYQNAKKVQKYWKSVKHLAEEGHKFKPCVALTTSDAEILGHLDRTLGDEDISSSRGEQNLGGNISKPHLSRNREDNMDAQRNGASTETHGRVSARSNEKLRHRNKKEEEERLQTEKREENARQQEARDKAQRARKDAQIKMRKKTQRGQPVMKHRIEHLLDTLQYQLA